MMDDGHQWTLTACFTFQHINWWMNEKSGNEEKNFFNIWMESESETLFSKLKMEKIFAGNYIAKQQQQQKTVDFGFVILFWDE